MGKRQDWSMLTACVFLFLSLSSQIHGRDTQTNLKEKDLIQSLPGQPPVNFRQYGGYLPVNQKADRFLYYYFAEAINPKDSTPLVIWFNGGPGCSSLLGALTTLGPFRVQSDGKTLIRNPYSWNYAANMLFLEGPIGVGFSYLNTPLNLAKEGEDGDKRTAEENYVFLMNWLERFPEYKNREVYITGESYAGHYAPQLAQIILRRKSQNLINLRGVMIGNPLLNALGDAPYKFFASHALIPQKYLDNFYTQCNNITGDCWGTIEKIQGIEKFFDKYNVYAPMCLNNSLSSKPKESNTEMEYDPCITNYLTAYLNRNEVQEAMHANTTKKIPYAWKFCNLEMTGVWNDANKDASQLPILKELMGEEGFRVWIYSGDMDSSVPTTSTLASLKSMNLTVDQEWSPWSIRGELGGYTETYKGNLVFATVKGAGHMVPTDKPLSALAIFTYFLGNTPIPVLR